MAHDGIYMVLINPWQRPPPPLVTVATSHTNSVLMPHIMFSRSVKFIMKQRGRWPPAGNTVCGSLMCHDSVEAARELIISSSILIIARNEHEWTSEGFSTAKRHHLAFFKFKSTDFNLLSSLVSLLVKMVMIGQIACQSQSCETWKKHLWIISI